MTTLAPSDSHNDGATTLKRSSIAFSHWLTPSVFSSFFGNKCTTEQSLTECKGADSDADADSFSPLGSAENDLDTDRSSVSKSAPGDAESLVRTSKSVTPKTRYSIAYPPPVGARKRVLQTKPKLALQFQKLNPPDRPLPAFDIVPFSAVEGKSGRRLPPALKRRYPCTGSVFAVVKAGRYNATAYDGVDDHTLEPEEDSWEPSRAVGVISIREDVWGTEITMVDGTTWVANWLSNGNLEFKSDDGLGQPCIVRWIARVSKGELKYKFTAIDPKSRKHPILASLDRSELAIHKSYKVPPSPALSTHTSPGVGQTPESPFFLASSSPYLHYGPANTLHTSREHEDFFCTTTEQMWLLIVATSVCIAFKEGWSVMLGSENSQKDIHGDMSNPTSVTVLPARPGISSSPPPLRNASLPIRLRTQDTRNKRDVNTPRRSVTITSALNNPRTTPRLIRSNSTGGNVFRLEEDHLRTSLPWSEKRPSQPSVQEKLLRKSQYESELCRALRAYPPSSYGFKESTEPHWAPSQGEAAECLEAEAGSRTSVREGGQSDGSSTTWDNNATKERRRSARLAEGVKRLVRRKSTRE